MLEKNPALLIPAHSVGTTLGLLASHVYSCAYDLESLTEVNQSWRYDTIYNYEAYFQIKPDLSSLRVFGCLAYYWLSPVIRAQTSPQFYDEASACT